MGTVWDSDYGQTCALCARPIARCNCQRGQALEEGDGIVRLRIEKSGRKGKTVTVISGLPARDAKAIFKALKKRCGAGGSLTGCEAEIQGDQRALIRTELERRELTVRG